jgi:hypothetical protein
MTDLGRKTIALAIVATAAGLVVEMQLPEGKWQRAPLSGAVVIATVAVLEWADRELSGE